jgi:hypothetical protein
VHLTATITGWMTTPAHRFRAVRFPSSIHGGG